MIPYRLPRGLCAVHGLICIYFGIGLVVTDVKSHYMELANYVCIRTAIVKLAVDDESTSDWLDPYLLLYSCHTISNNKIPIRSGYLFLTCLSRSEEKTVLEDDV